MFGSTLYRRRNREVVTSIASSLNTNAVPFQHDTAIFQLCYIFNVINLLAQVEILFTFPDALSLLIFQNLRHLSL